MRDPNAHPPSRRYGSFRPAFIGILIWIGTLFYLYYAYWSTPIIGVLSYGLSLIKTTSLDLRIEVSPQLRPMQVVTQVRIDGSAVAQVTARWPVGALVLRQQVQVPLRAVGAVEVRLAAQDVSGCVFASGIVRYEASGELVHTLLVQLVPLSKRYCPDSRSTQAVSIGIRGMNNVLRDGH